MPWEDPAHPWDKQTKILFPRGDTLSSERAALGSVPVSPIGAVPGAGTR